MKILVLGGTRFFGIHMVNDLIEKGHEVTMATRGKTKDTFGNAVKRITVERTDAEVAPYNQAPDYSVNVDRAKELGYQFTGVKDWIYELVDSYIRLLRAPNK